MTGQSVFHDSSETFGDLLKFLRRREHLTQLELSISVGYSEAQISRLENNQRLPDLAALKALFIPALHLENETDLATRFVQLAQSALLEDVPTPGIAPYKGLLFFEQADSDLFFGREALTKHLADRVTDLAQHASSRFLAVVGASGSGKSSLIRAGLAVDLGRKGWEVHIFVPTAAPLKMLTAICATMRNENSKPVIILVDQFEETFTLCREEAERVTFIEKLVSIARDPSGQVIVIIALRADFYSHCAQYPLLREVVAAEQEYIGQMTREELRRAIEEPAKHGGWEFEPGLVNVLLNDIGAQGAGIPEPGALPLLSHALLETWERRRGNVFTIAGYHASGGVRGAIAETAESVFTDHLNRTQQELARDIFLRLTELGEGTEDTRRRALLKELVRQSEEAIPLRAVLNMLADARLITLNEDSAEVAHEALIREWKRLHEWLTSDRDGLRLHRHITDSAHEWENRGHDPADLYRGVRLAQAQDWALVNGDRLNPSEHAFISASVDQEQSEAQEREAQRQRELKAAQELAETQTRAAKQLRRRALFLAGALGLAIVMAGATFFFGNQANMKAIESQKNAAAAIDAADQAESERVVASSREIAAAAISNLEDDPERSILLALQAETTADTIEAQNALHHSILASRVRLVVFHDAAVWSVVFSPDGKRIGTASQDKTARIWNANTGQLLLTLAGHTDSVNGIVYSADGKRIATTSDDHTAKIWDAITGKELFTLSGHSDWVYRIAFSPDGTRLVTGSNDKTAKVWDAATGRELLTFYGHQEAVFDVAYSPDGKRIATSGKDGFVRVWDADTGKESLSLPIRPGTEPRGVTFSSDGSRIAVGSDDGSHKVQVWNAATGELLLSSNLGHPERVIDIAFSPDGKLAATAGADGKGRVWNSVTGQVLYVLSGHTMDMNGIAFSPDGTRLATASWDGTARIWDITPAKELLFIPFADSESAFWSGWLEYSPDGTRIISDYTDSDARIWDAATGEELIRLEGHTSEIGSYQVSLSPDGKLAAAGSDDGKIIVWNAQTGAQLVTLVGLKGFIAHTAFSPDDTRLVSANSDDGTIMIWDLASGNLLFTLAGSNSGVRAVVFSPNGKQILSGDNNGIGTIWNAATGEKIFSTSKGAYITSVAYSPDGKQVALASIDGISIRDAITGKELQLIKVNASNVNAVTFSPDNKLVASASNDGNVRLWDAFSGRNILTFSFTDSYAGGVAFSPDGKRIAVGGKSGIYTFLLPIQDVIALAKSRLTRTLTQEECQQYLHLDACPSVH